MPEMQIGQSEDVLTLAEAASFLRISEAELLRLVETHDIPAQFEKRLLGKLGAETPVTERGSKRAVMKHFGIFKDEENLDEGQAGIRTRRKAAGG
jgi:hypothetical protein